MIEPKYKAGDIVYCSDGFKFKKHTILKWYRNAYLVQENILLYNEADLFPTKQALLDHIKKQIDEL